MASRSSSVRALGVLLKMRFQSCRWRGAQTQGSRGGGGGRGGRPGAETAGGGLEGRGWVSDAHQAGWRRSAHRSGHADVDGAVTRIHRPCRVRCAGTRVAQASCSARQHRGRARTLVSFSVMTAILALKRLTLKSGRNMVVGPRAGAGPALPQTGLPRYGPGGGAIGGDAVVPCSPPPIAAQRAALGKGAPRRCSKRRSGAPDERRCLRVLRCRHHGPRLLGGTLVRWRAATVL